MTDNSYFLVFTLFVTIAFSFAPEQLLKPAPARISNRSIVLQSLLVSILFFTVTLIVQRLVFASLAVSIFLIILSGVSNAKFQALRESLVFSDIAMFSQAFKHPRLYFPFLGFWPVVIMPLVIIALIVALFMIEPAMAFTWQRISLTIIAIILCFVVSKKIAEKLKLSEDPAIDNRDHGLLNSLFAYEIQARTHTHKLHIERALNNSPFAIKSTSDSKEKTPPTFLGISSDQSDQNTHHNITVIQSESFFDARRLSTKIKRNVLENYDSCLDESLQYGKLDVPAWGANTMRTEFSFLTGLKYEDMGLYRYYPYQYLHKMQVFSLAKLLQSQGYHCVCIHPHPASFFGRDRIYPQMGFDEFIDIDSFDNKQTFGPYISDQAVTNKILEISKKYTDKPLFIFAITMENHGPLHLEKTSKDERQTYFSKEPMEKSNDLSVYLRHLKNADKMIADLTSAYRKQEQSSTICFYGDHIPSMPKIYQELSYEDRDSDYFIWNNKASHISTSSTTSDKVKKTTSKTIKVDTLAETLLKMTGNIK